MNRLSTTKRARILRQLVGGVSLREITRIGLSRATIRAMDQWSTVTIEPADGRTCKGCGTFRRTDLASSRNLSPAEEANAVREERARRYP